MQILKIGLSHKTAPIEIREQLSLSEAALPSALGLLCPQNSDGPAYALEGAILSTCNRLEVYAVANCAEQGRQDILNYLARISGVPPAIFVPHLQIHQDDNAVAHLCQVACGIDSMILGESQVQGQVARAHQLALAHGAAGAVINTLFRTALQAGKRARTETAINRHATSISHAAVELALQIFDNLSTKTALLIGAGEMAELAAKNLVDHGVGQLLVVNRSTGRGAALARQFNGKSLGWDRLTQALWSADIVISSTAAPHAILRPDAVTTAMRMRHNRPLFLIDIAVPRDIDPAVGDLPNVFLYDIDNLQQVVDANLEQRRRQIPHVQAIICQQVAEFMAWFRSRDVVPTIVDLRQHVDGIRETELAWALQKLEQLSDKERRVIHAFSQRLVNKILHQPTVQLKQRANGCEAYRYADTVRDLFALNPKPDCPEKESPHG